MAIGHLSIRSHTRSRGHSVAAGLAYRFRTTLVDRRTGRIHDYDRPDDQAVAAGFAYGDTRPAWDPEDPQAWADAIERAERRKNSIVARDMDAALPHELTPDQREQLARDFAMHVGLAFNVPVAWAIHKPSAYSDARNHHAHFYVATRALDPETRLPGRKLREFTLDGSSDTVMKLRHEWQTLCNDALDDAKVVVLTDPGDPRGGAAALLATHAYGAVKIDLRPFAEVLASERRREQARMQSQPDIDAVDMSAFARHDGYDVIRRKSSEPIVVVDRHGATRTIRGGATASVVENRLNGWTHTKIDPTALAAERHARDVRDGDAKPSSRPAQLTEPPSRGRQSVARLLEDGEPVTERGRRGRRSLEERRANRTRRRRRRTVEQALRETEPVTETVPPAPAPQLDATRPAGLPAPIPNPTIEPAAAAAEPERDEPEPATPAPAADPAQELTARRRGRRPLDERRANRKRRRRAPPAPTPAAAPTAAALPPPRPATLEIAVDVRLTAVAPMDVPGYVGRQLDPHAVAYTRPDTPHCTAFVDTGRRIRVHAHDDPDAILAALRLAKTRFEGRQIVVRGSPAFRQLSLAIAARHGIRAVEAKRAQPDTATAKLPRAAAPPDPVTALALPAPRLPATDRRRAVALLPRAAAPPDPVTALALPAPRLPATDRRRAVALLPRAAAPPDPVTALALPAPRLPATDRRRTVALLPRAAAPPDPVTALALPAPRLPATDRRRAVALLPRAAAPPDPVTALALPATPARVGKRPSALPRVAVAPRLTPPAALPRTIHRSLNQLHARIAELQNQVARLLAAGRTGATAPSATPAKTSSIPTGTTSPVRKSGLGIKEMWTGRRAARQKRRAEAQRQRDEAERRRAEADRARITHPKYAAYRQSLEDGG